MWEEETKGPGRRPQTGGGGYSGAGRGGGDRGGRGGRGGGDRGGRGGGQSGFGSAPHSLVSNTPPGAIKLISNHFKLRVVNMGTISLYSVDFGETISRTEQYLMRESIRNCSV